MGDLWEQWGLEACLSPCKISYTRPPKSDHDIVGELRKVEDFDIRMQVGMILDEIENSDAARAALDQAYDAPEVAGLGLYNVGDGAAMSGLLLAGKRANGEATFLMFLLD